MSDPRDEAQSRHEPEDTQGSKDGQAGEGTDQQDCCAQNEDAEDQQDRADDRKAAEEEQLDRVLERLHDINERLRRLTNLSEATAARDQIGQAQGILMERYGLNTAQALSLLLTASQNSDIPLSRTASILLTTGDLPGPAASRN
ncbi:ANTAR domain-containing protein [Arthrobacter sp. CP30]